MSSGRPTFALIPGAGTDPRVCASTIEVLGALGHDALAPRLPLHEQAARPSDHADAVARAVLRDAELVVVAQLLGAMIPTPGETAGEWWGNTGHEQAIAEFFFGRYGAMSAWGADAIAEVLLHDVDPAVARDNERSRARRATVCLPGPGRWTPGLRYRRGFSYPPAIGSFRGTSSAASRASG